MLFQPASHWTWGKAERRGVPLLARFCWRGIRGPMLHQEDSELPRVLGGGLRL